MGPGTRTFIAFARRATARAGYLALAICMTACAVPAMSSTKPAMCGPFGNPPAVTIGQAKPHCWGGKLLGPWTDLYGSDRYACLYEPKSMRVKRRLPLIVYLHPSLFGAETIRLTNLLLYRNSALVSGDRKRRGFIVLAPLGRVSSHHYPYPDNKGLGWDNWYRQLNPAGNVTTGGLVYHQNADAAAIDHFIDVVEMQHQVDLTRIYVTGWSNGAAMGYLYALNRPNIAAVAAYSGPDPFGAFDDPCPQIPVRHAPTDNRQIEVFNPDLPMMQVHDDCDLAGICPNCERLAKESRSMGAEVHDTIINFVGRQVSECMQWCGTNPNADLFPASNPLGWSLGLSNHGGWPLSWTSTMLDFFRDHPLSVRR